MTLCYFSQRHLRCRRLRWFCDRMRRLSVHVLASEWVSECVCGYTDHLFLMFCYEMKNAFSFRLSENWIISARLLNSLNKPKVDAIYAHALRFILAQHRNGIRETKIRLMAGLEWWWHTQIYMRLLYSGCFTDDFEDALHPFLWILSSVALFPCLSTMTMTDQIENSD